MLSNELEYCLNDAFHQAREARHEYLTVEHLLLAILDTPKVREILQRLRRGPDQAQAGAEGAHRPDDAAACEEAEDRDVQPTLGFQRVLQRAVFHVQSSGKKEVGVANVLVAIFSEKQSHAVYLLNRQDVSRLDVVNYISHGLSKIAEEKHRQGGDAAPMPSARAKAAAARWRSTPPTSIAWRRKGKHRSADRPQARGRAHHRDPVPPAQEQSAVRRRGRRRQDRDRRRPGAPDRRGQGARRALRLHHLFASTWAR